jgi:hypothetical protein
MRRIALLAAFLACPAPFVVGCSTSRAPVPEVSSTTGPAVTARLDRCYIDPSLGHQAVAEVTAVNHSGTVHDIVVAVQISTDAGAHEDIAVVHSVAPGQSRTGGTSNHLDDSHRPACVITDVEGI